MLSNTLRLKFTYLKIIYILHSCYHLKIKGDILKNKQKRKRVFTNEITRIIIMKMKGNIESRSHRCDINRTKSRCGRKHCKYEKCRSMMVLICFKQHLSNIWSSIHDKIKQQWGWVEKNRCLYKKSVEIAKAVEIKNEIWQILVRHYHLLLIAIYILNYSAYKETQ